MIVEMVITFLIGIAVGIICLKDGKRPDPAIAGLLFRMLSRRPIGVRSLQKTTR